MDIKQEKRYACAVCFFTKELIIGSEIKEIVEERIKHTYEGPVPDQNNCDLNKYSDYKVTGGKLFKNRPHLEWESESMKRLEANIERIIGEKSKKKEIHIGGICEYCLTIPFIRMFVSHILFEEERR